MARLEHIGIAVQDAEPVARVYHDVLGVLPYKTETVESQSVRTHFISADTAKLELLEATKTSSPITKFLERQGEGLHHLAFEVDDADLMHERMQDAGYRVLGDAPSPGADGKRIFFLHPKDTHGVLVEFCETVAVQLKPDVVERSRETSPRIVGARSRTLRSFCSTERPAARPSKRHRSSGAWNRRSV